MKAEVSRVPCAARSCEQPRALDKTWGVRMFVRVRMFVMGGFRVLELGLEGVWDFEFKD